VSTEGNAIERPHFGVIAKDALSLENLARSLGITHLTGLDGVERLGLFAFAAIRPGARGPTCSVGGAADEALARRRALEAAIGAALLERPRAVILESEVGLEGAGLAFVPGSELGLFPERPRAVAPWIEGCAVDGTDTVRLPYAALHEIETVPEPPGGRGLRGGLGTGSTRTAAVDAALADAVAGRAMMRLLDGMQSEDPAVISSPETEVWSRVQGAGLRVRGLCSSDGAVIAVVWDDQGGIGLAASALHGAVAAWDAASSQAIADWAVRRAGLLDSVAPLDTDPAVRARLIRQLSLLTSEPVPIDRIQSGVREADRSAAFFVSLHDATPEMALAFAKVVLRTNGERSAS
jgi:hypothetical protein